MILQVCIIIQAERTGVVLWSVANFDFLFTPSETAVPYTTFKNVGYEVKFATEAGKAPQCDKKMLEGFTQRLLVFHVPMLPLTVALALLIFTVWTGRQERCCCDV